MVSVVLRLPPASDPELGGLTMHVPFTRTGFTLQDRHLYRICVANHGKRKGSEAHQSAAVLRRDSDCVGADRSRAARADGKRRVEIAARQRS